MAKANNVIAILKQAKKLAIQYRQLTGRSLGITAELSEYEAAIRLKLKLAPAGQAGYDATETVADVEAENAANQRELSA